LMLVTNFARDGWHLNTMAEPSSAVARGQVSKVPRGFQPCATTASSSHKISPPFPHCLSASRVVEQYNVDRSRAYPVVERSVDQSSAGPSRLAGFLFFYHQRQLKRILAEQSLRTLPQQRQAAGQALALTPGAQYWARRVYHDPSYVETAAVHQAIDSWAK
jgi:hypothetical protein